MQALIDFIVRNLLALWPIARVYDWQEAMRVRNGRIKEELSPGLHWRWWFIDEVKVWPGNEVGLDLAAGSVTTSDGQAISVSANVSYRCVSIAKMYRALWNHESTLKLVAIGHIASECATMTWAQLRERRNLEASLLVSLNATMNVRGIEVISIRLTDCVPSHAQHLYHDGKVPT